MPSDGRATFPFSKLTWIRWFHTWHSSGHPIFLNLPGLAGVVAEGVRKLGCRWWGEQLHVVDAQGVQKCFSQDHSRWWIRTPGTPTKSDIWLNRFEYKLASLTSEENWCWGCPSTSAQWMPGSYRNACILSEFLSKPRFWLTSVLPSNFNRCSLVSMRVLSARVRLSNPATRSLQLCTSLGPVGRRRQVRTMTSSATKLAPPTLLLLSGRGSTEKLARRNWMVPPARQGVLWTWTRRRRRGITKVNGMKCIFSIRSKLTLWSQCTAAAHVWC